MCSLKLGRSRFSWRAFIGTTWFILVARFFTDLIYFEQSGVQPLTSYLHRVTPRPKNISREISLEIPTEINREPPLSICESNVSFQYGVAFGYGDLPKDSYKQVVLSSQKCCQQCEDIPRCTHWTMLGGRCILKNSATSSIKLANAVSGRVTLNKYLLRRSISVGKLRYPCTHDPEDKPFFDNSSNAKSFNHSVVKYIVVNEPRSGSSWLQEMSQMHPGVKVQFELDLLAGDAALSCAQCRRPMVPDSKHLARLPRKTHPPRACGLTMFSGMNRFSDVAALAGRHNASLVVVLRRDHLAHAISAYLHFNQPKRKPGEPKKEIMVPWDAAQLRYAVYEARQGYERLTQFPAEAGRPAHMIFYEDMRRDPAGVWRRLQLYLGLPLVKLPAIEQLEAKSTSRPSPHYLTHYRLLRQQLNGTDLGRALDAACPSRPPAAAAAGTSPPAALKLPDGSGDGGGGDPPMSAVAAAAAAAAVAAAAADGGAGEEFAALCARYPDVGLSWRLHRCQGGVPVLWDDDPHPTLPASTPLPQLFAPRVSTAAANGTGAAAAAAAAAAVAVAVERARGWARDMWLRVMGGGGSSSSRGGSDNSSALAAGNSTDDKLHGGGSSGSKAGERTKNATAGSVAGKRNGTARVYEDYCS